MYYKVIIISVLLILQSVAFPNSASNHNSFIVKRSNSNVQKDASNDKDSNAFDKATKIYEMRVDSNITNRFAHTLVTSKVKNPDSKAQEAVFSIVLPKKAFISKFVMSIGDKDYEAYVQEKQKAQTTYSQAVSSGQGAGLVAASARESNSFTVSVNVEPESKVIFYLTYEELLERRDSQYELVINIHPKQPVKDLTVYVNINESQPLAFVKAPSIRSGNEISKVEGDLDPRAHIHHIDANSATVKFSPNIERQKELAKILGTNVNEGLSGQFIVQYDVDRISNSGGEILVKDGYFVHFFAQPHLKKPLPKYVLFVLDTSGSMYDTKLKQLKAAMRSILRELKDEDKFHLVEFNSMAKVLNLYNGSATVQYPTSTPGFYRSYSEQKAEDINRKIFVDSYNINQDNIKKAIETVDALYATGGTNIADALKVALYLVEIDKKPNSNVNKHQPMIIFLTDGDATVGNTNSRSILSGVLERNIFRTPIYSLSFGDDADKKLLKKLSLQNNGFSRHIYEAADASLQLEDFYKQISSPLLSNVTFKYVDEAKELSKTNFPILFNGSELVVVGRLDQGFSQLPQIRCHGVDGEIVLIPELQQPATQLERLWAYLTIQQLFDDIDRFDNKTAYEKKALDLALKYSFVTPVSSLVVVKPNSTDSSIQPISADKRPVALEYAAPFDFKLHSGFSPRMSSPVHFSSHFARVGGSTPILFNQMSIARRPYFARPAMILPTTIAPPLSIMITPIEKLKINLTWLSNILNNDIITTSAGNFKLGLNETSTDGIDCPISPRNDTGFCKLLHECQEVHNLLTTVDTFLQYRCDIKGFAAICCPKKSTQLQG